MKVEIKVGEIASVFVDVFYRCSSCGKPNLSKQKLSGTGSYSIFSFNAREQAQENLQRKADQLVNSSSPDRFIDAGLSCTCRYCKKREPWADMRTEEKKEFLSKCFQVFLIVTLLLLLPLSNIGSLAPIGIAMLVGCSIASAVTGGICLSIVIRKQRHQKKMLTQISQLPPEYLPKFYPYSEELHNRLQKEIDEEVNPKQNHGASAKSQTAQKPNWVCPKCGRGNSGNNTACWSCDYQLQ